MTTFTIEGGQFQITDVGGSGTVLFAVSAGGTNISSGETLSSDGPVALNGGLTVKSSAASSNLAVVSAAGVALITEPSGQFTVKSSSGGTAVLGVTSVAGIVISGQVSATSIGGTGWNLRLCVTDGSGTVYYIPARSSTF